MWSVWSQFFTHPIPSLLPPVYLLSAFLASPTIHQRFTKEQTYPSSLSTPKTKTLAQESSGWWFQSIWNTLNIITGDHHPVSVVETNIWNHQPVYLFQPQNGYRSRLGAAQDSHRNHQRAMDISNVLAVFFSMCFFFCGAAQGQQMMMMML